MNAGMTIALILALALAAIGSSTRYQADVGNSSAGVRGVNLNHNETLVRDTTLLQHEDWSLLLSNEQAFDPASLLTQFLLYSSGCSPMVCGSNHNETLVRDTTPME